MYRYLTARICAAVLVFALVVKPCIGLLKGPQAIAFEAVVAEQVLPDIEGEGKQACKKVCLAARLEDSKAKLPASINKATGLRGLLPGRADEWLAPDAELPPVEPVKLFIARKRLALLSRLLL